MAVVFKWLRINIVYYYIIRYVIMVLMTGTDARYDRGGEPDVPIIVHHTGVLFNYTGLHGNSRKIHKQEAHTVYSIIHRSSMVSGDLILAYYSAAGRPPEPDYIFCDAVCDCNHILKHFFLYELFNQEMI